MSHFAHLKFFFKNPLKNESFFHATPFKVSSKHEDKTVTQNVILLYILVTKTRQKRAIV